MRFELTLPKGNSLAGYRVNHSATASCYSGIPKVLNYFVHCRNYCHEVHTLLGKKANYCFPPNLGFQLPYLKITMRYEQGSRRFPMSSTIYKWANDKGAFIRQASSFRNFIKKGTDFEPEAGRYVLYVSYACPWVPIHSFKFFSISTSCVGPSNSHCSCPEGIGIGH